MTWEEDAAAATEEAAKVITDRLGPCRMVLVVEAQEDGLGHTAGASNIEGDDWHPAGVLNRALDAMHQQQADWSRRPFDL